ncbi:MAG: malonate-semialdehyde dehydrogenase (acetylating) / methylmalonate-semialdehyde dehydrogenase, partial [Solirubrobacteraceae bacterium]|nr:malonate-semialdehyde dehydrogenase (acetylating) / methylmalonate-semialdehyde dehydrogenase [Solirubrobacteraceae bacterium]
MNASATSQHNGQAADTGAEPALIPHWIGGAAEAPAGRSRDVTESATGATIARVPLGSAQDADRAVAHASGAAGAWGAATLAFRTQVLFRFRGLVDAYRDDLAQLITREHGKVLDDARGEVARGLEVVDFACGLPHLLKGEMSGSVSGGVDSYSLRQPLGVVAGITPFNFPVMVPLWMFPVALAAGNAFIL